MKTLARFNSMMTGFVVVGCTCICAFSLVLAYWAADRDAPFVMLDYKAPSGYPGEVVVIHADVRRDLKRRCNVMFSRVFLDSKGTRFELTDGAQYMNSRALEDFNRRSPDLLKVAVTIPQAAAPGVGTVMTVLDYECNPVHQIYPIPMVMNFNLEVLP